MIILDQIEPWRKILRQNFTNTEKLTVFLCLDEKNQEKILRKQKFSLNLPLRLAQKIKKNDLNDPILKQFLPLSEETKTASHFLSDPVGDTNCRLSSKLLHKYQGRVLILVTSACAMHCRYCFRQNFEYAESNGFLFQEEIKLILEDSSIHEVILSGGDPLSLSNKQLQSLIEKLEAVPHVKRLRFHTRFPIGIPERIDEGLIEIFNNCKLQIWFVLHINHSQELDEEILSRVKKLQRTGAVILNQAVLLKGINDDAETLSHLFETLADHGILPYYLHQLDRVQGALHFEVEEEKGLELMQEISKKLSGYAVPKYVREIAGKEGKTPIIPENSPKGRLPVKD
ncbi:MAG TPA: EF-P beta-lysylation protein EpmB [Parachlamydiaceae bacterium]|nr:EF-P beta-lysylation protein EpmB [Parachlamydiaceae bacterium]